MEIFAKIVNSRSRSIFSQKNSILDVCHGFEYASAFFLKFTIVLLIIRSHAASLYADLL